MIKALCFLVGLVVGVLITLILLIAVEWFGAVVHPFPEGFTGSHEEMCQHVARYPQWVLAVVVPIWGLTAFVGTWIARRIGGRAAAITMGLLLVAAVLFNVASLPYVTWFKIASVFVIVAAVVLASRRLASDRLKGRSGEADETSTTSPASDSGEEQG